MLSYPSFSLPSVLAAAIEHACNARPAWFLTIITALVLSLCVRRLVCRPAQRAAQGIEAITGSDFLAMMQSMMYTYQPQVATVATEGFMRRYFRACTGTDPEHVATVWRNLLESGRVDQARNPRRLLWTLYHMQQYRPPWYCTIVFNISDATWRRSVRFYMTAMASLANGIQVSTRRSCVAHFDAAALTHTTKSSVHFALTQVGPRLYDVGQVEHGYRCIVGCDAHNNRVTVSFLGHGGVPIRPGRNNNLRDVEEMIKARLNSWTALRSLRGHPHYLCFKACIALLHIEINDGPPGLYGLSPQM